MRKFLRGFAVLLTLLPIVAHAQQKGWTPTGGAVSLAASSTSANVALPTGIGSLTPSVKVCNTSSQAAYVAFGGSTVTAYSSTSGANLAGSYVAGGLCELLAPPTNATYIAAVTSTSTATLIIEVGSGSPQAAAPGGGGGAAGNPGGSSGQVQYNNSGAFGGFTQSGDCTTNTATGATTCSTLNGVSPGTLFGLSLPSTGAYTYSSGGQLLTGSFGNGFTCSGGVCNLTQALDDQSGAGTAIVTGMQSETVLLGAHTYTLAQAGTTGFTSGWGTCLLATTGPAVVNATTSTFVGAGGGTSITLQTGDWACPSSNGTNYVTNALLSSGTGNSVRATSTTLVSPALGTPTTLILTNATGLPAAQVPATPLATGTSVSLSAPREYYVCTGTCTVTPPVPAAGYEFCVRNDDNVATVITLAALGSSAMYEKTAWTSYGTAGTGTAVSGGAAGDKLCIVGRDSTHYLVMSFNGSWTMN